MSAVPDPHVDELGLLSYEAKQRSCKDIYSTPRKGDYIEVLWILDTLPLTPMRWCPAEVLHISRSSDQDCLARGIIRYIPGETWGQQFAFVDFLQKYNLRCSKEEEDDGCDSSGGDISNENPSLEWRFSKHSGDESDSDEDETWYDDTSQKKGNKTKALIRAHEHGTDGKHNSAEIERLRKGHASLLVEVEKVKTQLINLSQQLATVQHRDKQDGTCTSSHCVLPRIRQKLALKMQAGLRQMPNATRKRKHDEPDQVMSLSRVDGVYPGVIRARVECSLKQFESVSRHIQARSRPGEVFYFPDFSHTQLPLLCSLEFRILFKTFSHLCEILGISSLSDKKEMARKCGNGPRGDALRFLGTYSYDEEDERRSAHFFPGTSCGDLPPHTFDRSSSDKEASSKEAGKADPLFPVLSRTTREWNMIDSRYRHRLRKEKVPLTALNETCSDLQAFAVTWKRAAEPGARGWSQALCRTNDVFGWLEICLPFVLAHGKQRCQELGGVGDDDMWTELLRQGICEEYK